jgi:branched-chain amino acid transport system substrate-binding protein
MASRLTEVARALGALLCLALPALAAAQPQPLVVGAVISQSGMHAAAAAEYQNGLVLWRDEVNAAGGLLGRTIELRVLDDGSEAVRAGPAYAELIANGAEVLIGPYGSAATLTGAAEAERARLIMLNAAGPSSQVYKRSPRYVFQTSAPYSAYAEGPLALAREAGVDSLFILARDDAASREMGEAAQAQARALGMHPVELEIYSGAIADFLPQLYKAMAIQAQGWLAFGEVRDAADMVKTLKRQGYVPKIFYARSSTDPRFITLVGQDAEHILGTREYDVRFPTAGNAAFADAYRGKWGAEPGAVAAAAYTAGTVLAEGVRLAGTTEAQKLRGALTQLQMETVLGRYRVDATGAQVGIKPPVMQIVKGRALPVWPATWAGERALAPFVAWADRELLR